MKDKIIQILKRPFVKSVIAMASGTAAAQIIKMALSPLITRLYGPDAFGAMGVFQSVAQIIIPISALMFPIAIVLPKSNENAKGIMRLSLYISISIAIVTSFTLIFFKKPIVDILNVPEVSSYLYLVPAVILFTALMQIMEQWLIRMKQFGITAKATFYQASVTETSKVGIGFFNPSETVLVVITALKNVVKATFMILLGRKTFYKTEEYQEKKLSLKSLAIKYKDFPMLRAPQAFIDALTQGLPVLMLTSFFTPVAAGFFTLCRTVLTIPSSLIGKAVGNVFYPRINEAANRNEQLTALIRKSVISMAGIGLIPYGLIVIFGPWFFSFVFGSAWVTAGEYARWLALSRFFRFANEPCLWVLPVLSAQSIHLLVTIFQTVIRIVALAVGFYIFNDDKVSVALYSLTGAFINFILIFITIRISNNHDNYHNINS